MNTENKLRKLKEQLEGAVAKSRAQLKEAAEDYAVIEQLAHECAV